MFLQSISLRNFRNHPFTQLNFDRKVNIFTGGNGEGKTNILEGIFYLTVGRSHRTHRDQELLRWGEESFAIKAEIQNNSGLLSVEVYGNAAGEKKIRLNGVEQKRLSDLVGRVNAVLFAPENLNLIKGGPAERRRFLDFAASQASPQYFFYLQKYFQVLQQRNRLLHAAAERKSKADTLEVWDEQLIEYGVQVIRRRQKIVADLQQRLQPIHRQLTDRQEDIVFSYLTSLAAEADAPPETLEKLFRDKLKQTSREELMRGYTVAGPHRDDFRIRVNDIDLRPYGSQGQQRTAALSLKLAEVEFLHQERREYPLLLLDDVMSELDDRRREFLLQYIAARLQTFITSTNLNPFSGLPREEAALFRVAGGQVEAREE